MALQECKKGSDLIWSVLSACRYYGDFTQVFNLAVKLSIGEPIKLSVNGGDWSSASKPDLIAKESDFDAILKITGYGMLTESRVRSIDVSLQVNSAASVCIDMLCVKDS